MADKVENLGLFLSVLELTENSLGLFALASV